MSIIPYKEWATDQARKLHICREALEMRIAKGTHPKPETWVLNKRLKFVVLVKEKREA